jgi:adenine-specific DNA-methyltransferase
MEAWRGKMGKSNTIKTNPINYSSSPKDTGAVYTPDNLASFVANKVVDYYLKDQSGNSEGLSRVKIIDPACGDGQLLEAMWARIANQPKRQKEKNKIINLVSPSDVLYGVDIDERALEVARTRLGRYRPSMTDALRANLVNCDAVRPVAEKSTAAGWNYLKKKFGVNAGFDILIANPPWGIELNNDEEHVGRSFALGRGQYDSSDIFVELSLSIVRPGGYCALIIPDSIFSSERLAMRKMLLTKSHVKFVARLGEGIFKNVFRGCVVIIIKKIEASTDLNNEVDCLRLTPDFRDKTMNGEMTFDEADRILSHKVSQKRFLDNKEFRLDLDVKADEETTLAKISSHRATLGNYIGSARGVELSKNGKVIRCTKCSMWMPLPKSKAHTCAHCGFVIAVESASVEVIVHETNQPNCTPLLVGESVKRYACDVKKWIDTTRDGINYKKKEIYSGDKIVVRKTGVGITATLDYSGAYTNQVVYIFKLNTHVTTVTLEFALAAMNSRAIYYYLAKNYGETEWRSHPYVTQTQILKLPFPEIKVNDAKQREIINSVTNLVKPYLEKGQVLPTHVDAMVEGELAQFYGLSYSDYGTIYQTINSVQALLPVKAIKDVKIEDIFQTKGKM